MLPVKYPNVFISVLFSENDIPEHAHKRFFLPYYDVHLMQQSKFYANMHVWSIVFLTPSILQLLCNL